MVTPDGKLTSNAPLANGFAGNSTNPFSPGFAGSTAKTVFTFCVTRFLHFRKEFLEIPNAEATTRSPSADASWIASCRTNIGYRGIGSVHADLQSATRFWSSTSSGESIERLPFI